MTPTSAPLTRAQLGAALATVAATAWLALVAHAEGSQQPVLEAWASIALLGLAPALVLGALAARLAAPGRLAAGAVLALAAALTAALGAAVSELLSGGAPSALGLLHDLAVAMFVAAPVGTLLASPASAAGSSHAPAARAAGEPVHRPGIVAPTTRRGFLQLGAGSVTTAAVGGLAARGVLPAAAEANTQTFELTITDGWKTIVNRHPAFFRGFKVTGSSGGPEYPGPPLGNPGPSSSASEIFEGDTIRLVITNDTPRDHTFLIERTASETPVAPVVGPIRIPAGSVTEIPPFTAPDAGTYLYRDAHVNNRLLGMHGVMVVQPQDVRANVPYSPGAGRLDIPFEVKKQYTWILQNYDPVLGELAATQYADKEVVDYPLERYLPRFFFINGETGDEASHNDRTVPSIPLQDENSTVNGILLRVVNASVATHSPHWHGNHVFIVQRNARPQPAGVVEERDVVRMEPLDCTDLILPGHTGYDAFPPTTGDPDHPALNSEKHPGVEVFPMHCHAEMSQSAAGGMYPLGMLTDWHLGETQAHVDADVHRMARQRAEDRLQPPRVVGSGTSGSQAAAAPSGRGAPRNRINRRVKRRARRRARRRPTARRA